MRSSVRLVVVALCALVTTSLSIAGCGTLAPKAPPNLTPQVQAQFYATYAIKDLDVIRDFANDASKTVPPLVSEKTLLTIVDWHQTLVTGVHAAPDGWKSLVSVGLDQLATKLSPAELEKFKPYIDAVRTFVKEVR